MEWLSRLLHLLPCICFCLHKILTVVLILTWLWLRVSCLRDGRRAELPCVNLAANWTGGD